MDQAQADRIAQAIAAELGRLTDTIQVYVDPYEDNLGGKVYLRLRFTDRSEEISYALDPFNVKLRTLLEDTGRLVIPVNLRIDDFEEGECSHINDVVSEQLSVALEQLPWQLSIDVKTVAGEIASECEDLEDMTARYMLYISVICGTYTTMLKDPMAFQDFFDDDEQERILKA